MLKKFVLFLGLGFFFPVLLFSQSTNVIGTVVDGSGAVWANATITANFVKQPGSLDQPKWTGGSFNQIVGPVTADNTGTFSIGLPSNSAIVPVINQWNFTICPKATLQCASVLTYVTGTTLNISSNITAAIATIVNPGVNPFNIPRIDNFSQVLNPNYGSVVFSNITLIPYFWNGGAWISLVGSGSGCTTTGTNLVKGNGSGGCFPASASDIVAAIGTTPVTNSVNAANAININGASVPTSAPCLGSNSSNQLITTPCSGIAAISTKTASYTLVGTDFTIKMDATSGPLTAFLPSAPTNGQIFNIKKIDSTANVVTINGNGKTIDNSGTQPLTGQYQSYTVQYDGTTWSII